MSNPLKGEAEFRGAKLLMNFDRFCRLEDATGKKMPQLVVEFGQGLGLSDLRLWFEAFLVDETSEADINALIHQGAMMQDYDAALKVLSKIMDGFFGTKKANPPKAG
jgi:hypothetical protein